MHERPPIPLRAVAARGGLDPEAMIPYGNWTARVPWRPQSRDASRGRAKMNLRGEHRQEGSYRRRSCTTAFVDHAANVIPVPLLHVRLQPLSSNACSSQPKRLARGSLFNHPAETFLDQGPYGRAFLQGKLFRVNENRI